MCKTPQCAEQACVQNERRRARGIIWGRRHPADVKLPKKPNEQCAAVVHAGFIDRAGKKREKLARNHWPQDGTAHRTVGRGHLSSYTQDGSIQRAIHPGRERKPALCEWKHLLISR